MAVVWRKIAYEDDVITKALMDADTVLTATSDNTPVATSLTEQTVLGRITGGHPAALSVAQLQALLFSAALPEDTSIQLDSGISGTGHWCGITVAGVLGATVAFGEIVYRKAADSQWYLAKADATATSGAVQLGICLVAGNDNDATTILLWGKVFATAYSLTVDAPVFISAATAGVMTATAPTGTTNFVVRIVGYCVATDELMFIPDSTYLELA